MHDVSVVEVGHEHHTGCGGDKSEQLPIVRPGCENGDYYIYYDCKPFSLLASPIPPLLRIQVRPNDVVYLEGEEEAQVGRHHVQQKAVRVDGCGEKCTLVVRSTSGRIRGGNGSPNVHEH